MFFCSIVLTIAHHKLPSQVLLAPMAGVTDTPWRLICQEWGAGLTTTEMLIANSALWDSEKSRLRLVKTKQNNLPYSVQIVGSDPLLMAESAKQAIAYGADIIDINMGCPAKKVCKKAAGSALLQDEPLVQAILHAVVNAVDIPVTLKIRTGWDVEHRNAVRIAKMAEQEGIQALAIHGRTRACRFMGNAEYDTIAEVKHQVGIPVIANGDIDSVEKALWVKQYTRADALMIGRGVQGRPWLIQAISMALQGEEYAEPSDNDKFLQIKAHIQALHQFYGARKGLGFARKHTACYLEHLKLSDYRAQFNQIKEASLQLQFFDNLQENLMTGKIA